MGHTVAVAARTSRFAARRFGDWTVHRHSACPGNCDRLLWTDFSDTKRWLAGQRFRPEFAALCALLCGDLRHKTLTVQESVALCAVELRLGRWHVCRAVRPQAAALSGTGASTQTSPAAATNSPAAANSTAVKTAAQSAAVTPPTDSKTAPAPTAILSASAQATQDALASTLTQAAAEAMPFCEECAALAATAEPPPSPAIAAQDAVAETLIFAAANASPFCEECAAGAVR